MLKRNFLNNIFLKKIFLIIISIIMIGICIIYLYINSIFFEIQDINIFVFEFFFYDLYGSNFFIFGFDGISCFFFFLTTFLILICILLNWNLKYKLREYLLTLFFIYLILIIFFSIFDLIIFFLFFEAILIPMFILIGIWGSRLRKVDAAYKFFIYTLFGSLFMLVALINIFYHIGTGNFFILINTIFSLERQYYFCLAFLISFSVKVPMFPFHLWLPEAHVEASTPGSVILAGILLKLGTYAILRFLIPCFSDGIKFFIPLIFLFSILSIFFSSLVAIRQIDIKKIIAYTSIAHMNFVILGLFSLNIQGLEGSYILMLSHGLVSSGLFICCELTLWAL